MRRPVAVKLRTQRVTHGRLKSPYVSAADSFSEGLRQSPRRADQRRPRAHQRISSSDHRKIRLRLNAPMLNRREQLRIDSGQPGQGLSVQPVVLAPALPDQADITGMRHDRFMPQIGEKAAYPWRMRPGFKCNSAPRHLSECLLHRFRAGGDPFLNNHIARHVEDTIEAHRSPRSSPMVSCSL